VKTWRRHRCLNELKMTCHYWVLSKTKLFYGWIILLFFILFFFKWKLFMCYLYYGVLNISDRWWRILSSVRIIFKKLDSAHKWINCCNKSLSVCLYSWNSLHYLFQLFCGLFSFTLNVFISTIVSYHHDQSNLKPKQTTQCSNMFQS